MGIRIRRSVYSLPEGDETLVWYARAIDELLRNRPISDPTSWIWMACVHGQHPAFPTPPNSAGFWDQCQHQSWYFLPWHRGYVAAFEAVVATTIRDLGGPEEWALPYWNYSEPLAANPDARLMPPAFRDELLPDGSPNFLWSRRNAVPDGDFALDDTVVHLDALTFQNFTNAAIGAPSGFGGPPTGFNPGGGDNGALESIPHNRVHTRIGGFMGDPATAALDPIFWLHHCNIDRLWEAWRSQGPAFANPDDPAWLTAVSFPMHDGEGTAFSFTAADMLDTTAVLHGYTYDDVPVAQEGLVMAGGGGPPAGPAPELVGTRDAPLPLGEGKTRARVELHPEQARRSFTEALAAPATRVYLNLENVVGTGTPGDFAVYVDLPSDDQPPLKAGVLTTFGLERASDPERPHGGNGLTQVLDITPIAARLRLTEATAPELEVSFVHEEIPSEAVGTPPGLEQFAHAEQREPRVEVGRISVYFE